MPPGRRTVLGCGTGDVTIPLGERVDSIVGVDPSASMLAVASTRPGADNPSVRWVESSAEEFEFQGPYSLVVAAESLHWMDWPVVLPKIAAALHSEGFLVLALDRQLVEVPWASGLAEIIPRYSTNQRYQPYDLVEELTRRGLFEEVGRHATTPVPFTQSVDEYVKSFHSRNGFSRERMSGDQVEEFDETVRALVERYCENGRVRSSARVVLAWGRPLDGESAPKT